MKNQIYRILLPIIIAALSLTACSLQETPPAEPTADIAATIAVELAYKMQTQTVAAYTPTSLPTPSETPTLAVTETPAAPAATSIPMVINDATPCYAKPGGALTSNISGWKKVELLGIGSVPGWYVIKNPYFYSPCWIRAEDLKIESDFDLSAYPTMYP